MKKAIIFLVLGFVLQKTVIELANFRTQLSFLNCYNKPDYELSISPYERCLPKLEYSRVEEILLYQPKLYCLLDKSYCGDQF